MSFGRPGFRQPQGHALGLGVAILVAYRLLDPGSEWRLYRHWFGAQRHGRSVGADLDWLTSTSFTNVTTVAGAQRDLFHPSGRRWKDLFNARFEVLLYD